MSAACCCVRLKLCPLYPRLEYGSAADFFRSLLDKLIAAYARRVDRVRPRSVIGCADYFPAHADIGMVTERQSLPCRHQSRHQWFGIYVGERSMPQAHSYDPEWEVWTRPISENSAVVLGTAFQNSDPYTYSLLKYVCVLLRCRWPSCLAATMRRRVFCSELVVLLLEQCDLFTPDGDCPPECVSPWMLPVLLERAGFACDAAA